MPQYDINLREYWWIFKKRKFIIITIAIILGIFSTTFAILRAPEPLYSTTCVIEFEKSYTAEGIYNQGYHWSDSDEIETHISVIKGYPVFQRVAEKMGLIPGKGPRGGRTKESAVFPIIENLQSKVQVTREKYSSILNIKVTDSSPVFTQKLANTIGLAYKEVLAEQQMRRTRETIKYIEEQLREVRTKLKEAEDEFNRFGQENELISIDLQSEDLLARAKGIKEELKSLQEDKMELEGIAGRLESFIKDPSVSDHDFYSEKGGNRYKSANDTLVGLLIKKETLLEDYTQRHPEVVAINRSIIESARKMLFILKLQMNKMESRMGDLRDELEQVNRKTKVLMDKKLEFNRLKRRVDLYHNMTVLLEKKNQEAMIRRADRPEVVNIIKPALLPTRPINPPKRGMVGATGTLIGIIIGLVAAFIVETFDTSLGAIEDVEETLGVQVLGVIPQANVRDIREGLREKYGKGLNDHALKESVNLVTHLLPKSMMAESFRGLRTNIQFKDADQKIRTLAVTSSTHEEGKTLVAINLAMTMAQAGIKTLLIGCDLRKPTVAKALGIEMAVGVTDILLGNYQWRDTVKGFTDIIMGKMNVDEVMMTPGLDNLHVITAGGVSPNPAELIESKRLDQFLEEVKDEYDIVVIDSTPILSTADAAILGRKVDAVLLVYRVGSVSRALLRRSTSQLKQIRCNVIGVVLNSMRPEVSPDFQDFKYYSYYSVYGEDDQTLPRHRKGLSKFGLQPFKGFKLGGILGRKDPSGKEKTRPSVSRFLMLIVAVLFLAGGITLHYGGMGPFQWFSKVKLLQREPGRPGSDKEIQGREPRERSASPPGGPPAEVAVKSPSFGATAPPAKPRQERAKMPKAAGERSMKSGEVQSAPERNSYPYSLKVGSFRELEMARKAMSLYEEKGSPVYHIRVHLSNGIWYRVYLGIYRDEEEAEHFKRDRGLGETVVVKVPHAVLVGTYRTKEEGREKLELLKGLDFSPYWMEDGGKGFRLCIGAFNSRDGAERKLEELRSKGIQGRIIKR
ncbi:MAG: polysaccharide biosynthesis tyrosine autokinase [Deltaproteobacteria bacterium]|nr:polysaccharide biosynthesis tyrosine autokinase [Deltaproteobacteria bacterium]